jgi:hypothetical protein
MLGSLVKNLQIFFKQNLFKRFKVYYKIIFPGLRGYNPRTKIELKLEGLEYKIDGCFRHRHYKTLSSFGEP